MDRDFALHVPNSARFGEPYHLNFVQKRRGIGLPLEFENEDEEALSWMEGQDLREAQVAEFLRNFYGSASPKDGRK